MSMTERIVVTMTPEQKEDIRRRAAAERQSMSGYMRRRVLCENEMLSGMLHELTASTARTVASVDQTLSRLEDSARRLPEIEAAARTRAIAEFRALDPALFAHMVLHQGIERP